MGLCVLTSFFFVLGRLHKVFIVFDNGSKLCVLSLIIMTKKDKTLSHDKPCTLCATPRSVLVRCQIDETGKWHFVCPGKCWHSVSGGVEDARGHEKEHPHYRYGGMVRQQFLCTAVADKGPVEKQACRWSVECEKAEKSKAKTERTTKHSNVESSNGR